MFRDNTLDHIETNRMWAINMASKTHEGQNATADEVLATAKKYLDFAHDYTVEDALKVQASRQEFLESLRDKVAVDTALREELNASRDALKAAKAATTEEEAEQLLRNAEFSFMQVATVTAETVAKTVGLNPDALGSEAE